MVLEIIVIDWVLHNGGVFCGCGGGLMRRGGVNGVGRGSFFRVEGRDLQVMKISETKG